MTKASNPILPRLDEVVTLWISDVLYGPLSGVILKHGRLYYFCFEQDLTKEQLSSDRPQRSYYCYDLDDDDWESEIYEEFKFLTDPKYKPQEILFSLEGKRPVRWIHERDIASVGIMHNPVERADANGPGSSAN